MHRTGVVGHNQFAETDPFDHFGQRSLSGEVGASGRVQLRDAISDSHFPWPAEDSQVEPREFTKNCLGKFDKMIRWPAFVDPTRSWAQENPSSRVRLPFVSELLSDIRAGREPVKTIVDRNVDQRKHSQVPVDGVSVVARAWNSDIVEGSGSLALVVHADREPAASQPREQAAASQSLQVDDQIETMPAHAADVADELGEFAWSSPSLAVKSVEPGQIAVALEHLGQFRSDPPIDFRGRVMLFEQAQDRQRLNDIAQRARLKDEDFQSYLPKASRSAKRSGRPAARIFACVVAMS